MTTSGTYAFEMANAQLLSEAFDRIQIRGPALTRSHLISAHQSLNLEMTRWGNLGINLWKVSSGTINLVAGTATYALPQQMELLTDLSYRTVGGSSAQDDSDRYMMTLTRQQYAMMPAKGTQGVPTQYWFQRLPVPQITLYPVPAAGAPDYILVWYGLLRMEDASPTGGQTPDIPYRAYDALCAALAHRLAIKFSEPAVVAARKADAAEAWIEFTSNDQEVGSSLVAPNVGMYGRLGS
jgi:hypothetical protein